VHAVLFVVLAGGYQQRSAFVLHMNTAEFRGGIRGTDTELSMDVRAALNSLAALAGTNPLLNKPSDCLAETWLVISPVPNPNGRKSIVLADHELASLVPEFGVCPSNFPLINLLCHFRDVRMA
jgi:hypothetical protein